jgi:hypothetical protein
MSEYKTCTYTYDNGRACKSAAAKGREFCGYHLHYRGRLLRRAQYRARHQRFDIILPPLDSLCSIQSALSEVAEALAADMIDPRRAMGLLKALRFAKENLKDGLKDDNTHWHDTPYLTQDAAAYDNFEADYGLPEGIDPNTPPEVAFPPPEPQRVIPSGGGLAAAVEGPAFSSAGNRQPATDNRFSSPMPTVDYCEHGPGCPEHTIRADYPETPELAELREIYATQGPEAAGACHKRQQNNNHRRYRNKANKRYAAIALETNLHLAAEKLAERKLAERAAAQNASPASDAAGKKPPATAGEASGAEGFGTKKEEAIA